MMARSGRIRRPARPSKSDWDRVNELADQAGIPPEQRRHLVETTVVDLDGALGGKRNSIVKVLMNRGGTAVDRWILGDRAGLFAEPQQRAIRYAQSLWAKADGSPTGSHSLEASSGCDEGASQSFALAELALLKKRFPAAYWTTFENIARWNADGSTMLDADSLSRTHRRTKVIVAFVAAKIAEWRGF